MAATPSLPQHHSLLRLHDDLCHPAVQSSPATDRLPARDLGRLDDAYGAKAVSAMTVLGYVHTFNDAEVIDGTIRALGEQSYPIPEILLVDNASTDGTLDRAFPSKVTILKNDQNLGTSGAVAAGMKYALLHGYDWIYILDADSSPGPDAIANLLRCYGNLSP